MRQGKGTRLGTHSRSLPRLHHTDTPSSERQYYNAGSILAKGYTHIMWIWHCFIASTFCYWTHHLPERDKAWQRRCEPSKGLVSQSLSSERVQERERLTLRKQTEEILIRGQLGQGRGEGRFTDINSTQFWPKITRGLEKISSFTSFLN